MIAVVFVSLIFHGASAHVPPYTPDERTKTMLAREAGGGELHLTEGELAPPLQKCRDLGLWGLDAPAELGGADLSTTALMLVQQELSRTVVPFSFPPESPVLRLLLAVANKDQRERYLTPYAEGKLRSATAISEPGAGADPAAFLFVAFWVLGDVYVFVYSIETA